MTNPQIDYAAMAAQWRAERETTLKASRAELLAQLRALGISEVTAEYEGYGDSGNVEDVTVQPAEVQLPEPLVTAVGDFAWSLAYHHHPGFENNEGGYGTLTWDLRDDSAHSGLRGQPFQRYADSHSGVRGQSSRGMLSV